MQDSAGSAILSFHTSEVIKIIQENKKGEEKIIVDLIEKKLAHLQKRGKGKRSQTKILVAALSHQNKKIEEEINRRTDNYLLQEIKEYAEAVLLRIQNGKKLAQAPPFIQDAETAGIFDEYRGRKPKDRNQLKTYHKFCSI